jgi:hypothetical protein
MDKEVRKKFIDMLKEERNSPTGMAVIMSMVSMLEDDPRFENLADLYEGIDQYKNFLTEREAKKVVEGFVSFDGSRGQHWSMDTIADELRKVGGVLEEKHHYNKWMLYALMNSRYADYGGALMKMGISQADMPKAIYYMALAKLDDKDMKETMREYFGLE